MNTILGNVVIILQSYLPLLLRGAGMTIALWLCSGIIAVSIGCLLGIASCQELARRFVSKLIGFYVGLARGVPAFVQILIAYYALPQIIGIDLSPFAAALIALGFCSGGYITEIVRSGINAIPKGQWDACYVLGYPKIAILQCIILPQMLQNILPALVGELDQLIKSTSLVAMIGVLELTRMGQNIIARELNPMTIYGLIALVYLCISRILSQAGNIIERRMRI